MSQQDFEAPKWLKRRIEDLLDLDDEAQAYATKALMTGRIEKSKDRLKQRELILGLDVVDDAIRLHKDKKKGIRGLRSGLNQLDRLTKGFVAGEVTIISARTSVGKTSLALAIAANLAEQGKPFLFLTLEMTQAQLMERFIDYTGGLNEDSPNERFMDIAGLTFMQKHERVTPDSIEGIIEKAKESEAQLVILDHIHYFSRGSKTDDIEQISIELSRTAKKYEIPIIAIAHTRKQLNQTGKPKDATMDDIRGASFISQDADIVLMLNRSELLPNELRVRVWKNRNAGIDYARNEITLQINGNKVTDEVWTT